MTVAETRWAALSRYIPAPANTAAPHATPAGAVPPTIAPAGVSGIDAAARIDSGGDLVFRYAVRGDSTRLRIAAAARGEFMDGLWQHTCFEAFIGIPGEPGYYEMNFATSHDWAVYRFSAYRQRMTPILPPTPPRIAVRCLPGQLEMDVVMRLQDFGGFSGAPRLQVALCAVLEDDGGRLSYWALRHPAAGKADFHAREGFALEIGALATADGNP